VRQARFDIPLQITAGDHAAVEIAVDGAIARAEAAGDEQAAAMWRREKAALTFAEQDAPWALTKVDDAGYLWLFKRFAASTAAAEGHRTFEARVAAPDGEYLGDTTLPPMVLTDFAGIQVVGGRLLALVEDPETAERVPTVYRIRPTIEGLRYPAAPQDARRP
jgi:hypothetical protein